MQNLVVLADIFQIIKQINEGLDKQRKIKKGENILSILTKRKAFSTKLNTVDFNFIRLLKSKIFAIKFL